MTALNIPLISKIERHLFDVSRLGSQTFGPVIAAITVLTSLRRPVEHL